MSELRRSAACQLALGAVLAGAAVLISTPGLAQGGAAQGSAAQGSGAAQGNGAANGPTTAAPSGPAAEVLRSYNGLKTNILKAADRMPTADFTYKPEPDIRTFARVLNHVTEAQLHSCGLINGAASSSQAKVPAETADKAEIIRALQGAFAECDKALATLTDANLSDSFGPMKRSRIGLLWGTVSHDNEQYATLALYLRLKGVPVPSMER